ncbi:MAG: hypothetical protein ACTSP2_06740, partial [Alphaproteobacteria bacterium]
MGGLRIAAKMSNDTCQRSARGVAEQAETDAGRALAHTAMGAPAVDAEYVAHMRFSSNNTNSTPLRMRY